MALTVAIPIQHGKYRTIESGTEFRYKQREPRTAKRQHLDTGPGASSSL